MKNLYLGIMSGTSLDAIDIALCQINSHSCHLISSFEHHFPPQSKKNILTIIKNKNSLEKIGQIDHKLGVLFGQSVQAFLAKENINPSTIRAIGLHGQTLWHHPFGKTPFTLQLGDPNLLTARLNIPVISDFRRKDVALGGQGAPFAPAFHQFFFSTQNTSRKACVLNIGGMANITILDEAKLLGYDTGCGNVLLDSWIMQNKNLSYDKEGLWAKSGAVDKNLLTQMLQEPFFSAPYPKSTGREKFNIQWIKNHISTQKAEDIQRTLLELTAQTITKEIDKFERNIVFICGGGAKNNFLIERIQTLLPHTKIEIAPHADMIEAMTFAWLAYKRWQREPVNLKDVTGASANTILGAIYE